METNLRRNSRIKLASLDHWSREMTPHSLLALATWPTRGLNREVFMGDLGLQLLEARS
jgi:hypothetical protein